MRPNTKTGIFPATAMKATAFALGVSLGTLAVSHSQTADALVTGAAIDGQGNKPAAKAAPEPEPVDTKPSRFAGQDPDPYIASRAAVFSMRNRETDPFGLFQDTNVKPVAKRSAVGTPARRQTALPPTPLADVIKLIRVTTIMPGERKFLVGIRPFSESDEFSLIFRGKKMRLKIVEVSASRILFMNLDNKEKATLETGMLPPGMIAGTDAMQPPGMVSPLDDVPLELGAPVSEEPIN